MSQCPDEDELLDGARARLPAEAQARLEAHLDGCAACCAVLAGLDGGRSLSLRDPPHGAPLEPEVMPQPGARVGRYVLLRRVGTAAWVSSSPRMTRTWTARWRSSCSSPAWWRTRRPVGG
ncbi:hypothetical protein [Corallococcus sp. 4LFB]|uniref:hypothetical protein n=1 Tax=Corallococcus sp. 4LFB TaxID=3383249 RepID=UPI003976BCFE